MVVASRRDCDCVRESHFVLECLGGCWETVESALCFDGDSITMSEQDSKVMSPNDDESIGFDGAIQPDLLHPMQNIALGSTSPPIGNIRSRDIF